MNIRELFEIVCEVAGDEHEVEVYDPVEKDFASISAVAWDGQRVRLLGEGLEKEFEKQGITEDTGLH